MDNETINKILRKKILWAEIKVKEQEYRRLCYQIEKLEEDKKDISFDIQKRIEESERISNWLLEKEYEALSERGL